LHPAAAPEYTLAHARSSLAIHTFIVRGKVRPHPFLGIYGLGDHECLSERYFFVWPLWCFSAP
jgi:hypothetical protein